MTFARTRWRVVQPRLVAAVALATAASVLAPLAQPAGATTTSVVTLTREASEIFEGGTAVYTVHADPAPTAPLTVTYEVSEGSANPHDTLTDGQVGKGKTITIPANETSATIQIKVHRDTRYLWASNSRAKAQGYGHPYCENRDSDGLPYLNPPSKNDNNVVEALLGDKQCAKLLGDLSNPSREPTYARGEVWVTITGVGTGGEIGTEDVGYTKRRVQVRDRSLWRERLAIDESGGNTTVAENGGTDTYTVALTQRPNHNVTVTVTSANPAAATVKTTGAAGASATMTFTPSNWNNPQTVTVTGVDDSVAKSSGKRTAVINHTAKSSDRNYQDATAQLTATVTDDDAANAVINLSTDVSSVNEDIGSAQTVTVTATLANGLTFDTAKTVAVSVTDSGAQNAVKFSASPNTFNITIPANHSSATGTFALTPTDDNAENPDGVATISGTAGGITVNAAKVGLVDDETKLVPRVSISVDNAAIKEKGTPNTARVTVTVNKSPSQTIDIGYTVSSGSAVQGEDYRGLDDKFEIDTTELTDSQSITALNDTLNTEGAETVTITLNAGTGYRLGANKSLTITIEDNTSAPSEPLAKFARAEPSDYGNGAGRLAEGWGSEHASVVLDPVPASAVTLNYSLSGTATWNSDYSITGANGATGSVSVPAYSPTVGIPVKILDDSVVESDETVVLTLTAATGYTLGTPKVHTLTIVDNDSGGTSATPGVTVSKSKVTVAEASGQETYTVVLDSQPANSVTIRATVSTPGNNVSARVRGGGGVLGL